MSRLRGSLPHALLISLVAAATVWITILTWSPLVEAPGEFAGPLFLGALVVAATGSVLRWLVVPVPLVVLAEVVLLGGFVLSTVTGSALPTGETLAAFWESLSAAVTSANTYQAPVPASAEPVAPIFVLVGAVALVLMDLLAVSWRRAAVSGLLLLGLYSVPVGLSVPGVSWWFFALLAGSFLLLLYLQQDESVSRWGRGTDARDDSAGFGVRTGAVRSSALAIGAGSTALAVFLPALVPTLDLQVWDGPGSGNGGDGISIDNPLVDMRRDLSRGADIPLLRVATEGPKPTYVRLSVLNRFNGDEWSSGDREVPDDQQADGDMPPLLGVSSALSRTETRYDFSASSAFDSRWLPTASQISRIEAPGDWRYDRATMDFISGDDSSISGLQWSLRGVQLDYDLEALDDASSGASQVGSSMVQLPVDMPPEVRSLAESVAGDEPSRFRKARALQDWFRTEFDYNPDRVDTVGNDELVAFLEEGGREGYCEQFAAAMAVMARMHDIPSRVAVGFLEPTEISSGMWEFSSHDLHAWPELFFPGSGWVRFEPTPAGRASQVPGYTLDQLPQVEETARPGVPRASEEVPNRGESFAAEPEGAGASDEAGSSVPWRTLVSLLVLLALALVAALGPRTVRLRRRDARLRDGSIECLWTELRDHCVDHGRPWPAGRSPRATADRVAEWFGTSEPEERPGTGPTLNPLATAALYRLVEVLERSRYGRPSTHPEPEKLWVRDLAKCTEAISAGVGPRRARRATWWPVSLVRRPADRPVGLTSSGRADAVDHVS